MSKKQIIVIFVLFLFIFFIGFVIFVGKNIFIVKNIEIEKNFDINKEKLLKYLGIKANRYIWNYNIDDMEKKLSKQYYLSYYKIDKKLPDTLKIKLKMRNPVACIAGNDGNIFFVDENGIIYIKNVTSEIIPLLICEKNNFLPGLKVSENIMDVIETLLILKESDKNVYNGISQIEIKEKMKNITEYIVFYRTINQRIYLKNNINVDLLREGFVSSLYLDEKGIVDGDVIYSGAGFVF